MKTQILSLLAAILITFVSNVQAEQAAPGTAMPDPAAPGGSPGITVKTLLCNNLQTITEEAMPKSCKKACSSESALIDVKRCAAAISKYQDKTKFEDVYMNVKASCEGGSPCGSAGCKISKGVEEECGSVCCNIDPLTVKNCMSSQKDECKNYRTNPGE